MKLPITKLGFDADGVLLDSRSCAWRTNEDLVALFGKRPHITTPEENAAVFSRTAQSRLAGEDGAEVLREMHRILMRHRADGVGVFQGILEIVDRLYKSPIIITAAYAAGVRQALGPQAEYFAGILGREEGSKKDLIEIFAKGGMRWYVTDTMRDIRRCHECGVRVIAVTWGYDPDDILRAVEPEILVSSPRELAQALAGLDFLQW